MIKVSKFGGSSVANAEQFRKVGAIVKADPARQAIVVSAVGKCDVRDNKVTDLLCLVNAHIKYHVDYCSLLSDIKARLVEIAEELSLTYPVAESFDKFARTIDTMSPKFIVSRGEWFTAQLLASYLGVPFVDAADVMIFHHDNTIDYKETTGRIRAAAKNFGRFVLPGFYGATREGEIRLFDRGGSDITGSIVACALAADTYENWTDVSGFLTADPRLVENPRPIRRITFDEMRELSYMGAKVLHEGAIFPVREANIPIVILNTNRPQDAGTIISEVPTADEEQTPITGIAGKKDFLAVHISKGHISDQPGVLRQVLAIFEQYGVSVEHVPTGIDSFGVVVHKSDVDGNIYSIVADIQRELKPDVVKVVDELALISVVGRNMSNRPGTAGRLFSTLGKHHINVRMITQSSQEISIIFGVNNADLANAIRSIYHAFVLEGC